MAHPITSTFVQQQDILRALSSASVGTDMSLFVEVVIAMNHRLHQKSGEIWELNIRIKQLQEELDTLKRGLLSEKAMQ